MPCGKHLTVSEKAKIETFHMAGKSNREISRLIGRSPKIINNYVKNPYGYDTKRRSGRSQVLSTRDVRQVQRSASNQVTYLAKINKDLSITCTRMTISNALKRGGRIQVRKMKKGPALTAVHRQKRLNFAANHITQVTN